MRLIHSSPRTIKPMVLLFLLGFTINSYAQGEYLHKGTSGMDLHGSYMAGQKIVNVYDVPYTSLGFGMGFSVKGVFDLQFGAMPYKIPADGYITGSEEDLAANVYGRVVIHPMKQSEKFPVSIRGHFSYHYSEYQNANTTEKEMNFGAGVYRRIYFMENLSIIPSLDFIIAKFEFVPDGAGLTLDGSDFYTVIKVPIAINAVRNHLLYLTPHLAFGSKGYKSSYGLTLGYMSPLYFRQK